MNCVPLRAPWFVSLVAAWNLLALLTIASGQPPAERPLPLKRVVLFSSGVGFFEHRGQVEGDQQVVFSMKTADINDLLKSLVVQDRGGGLVTAVNYASPEPIARTLHGFTLDLNASPSLAQMFQQLRGHQVELQAPAKLIGTVVGVEKRELPTDDTTTSVEFLNLRTEHGLESIRIDAIARTKFLNPQIEREFQQALDLLAGSRQSEQKAIKLQFRGQGQRDVAAGYIQEAPVWKTTYRLVLSEKQADENPQRKEGDSNPPRKQGTNSHSAFLQGWAIVENTTGQPWRDVQLSLVSGRPISFLMDLYQPLYATRPLVSPERYASLRPRVYEQDLSEQPEAEKDPFAAGEGYGGRRASRSAAGAFGGSGLGGMGGGMAGMGGGMGGGMPSRTRAGQGGESGGGTQQSSLDLAQGVAAAASGQELGTLFRYAIHAPVSLDRNESAMLPIVNHQVQAEKLAIYNPAVHSKHPLSGLRLTNTTDIHWMQGPITLFDDSEYTGDARIEDIPPAATRLISYALDLQTEVAIEKQPSREELVRLRIERGGLEATTRESREAHYVIKNAAAHDKKLLIERPFDGKWKPVSPTPAEETRQHHRYQIDVPAGKTHKLVVREEQKLSQQLALAALTPAQINVYLHSDTATPSLSKALQSAIERKIALSVIEANRATTEREIAEITADQSRLRTDDPFGAEGTRLTRDLAQRYLNKLGEQETELERLQKHLTDLKDQESRATRELEDHLKNLTVEP